MGRCCICNIAKSKKSGRTFHKFPLTNQRRLQEWMKQLPLKEWKPTKESFLCSDHFAEDCFDKTGFRVRLKPNGIPTRFENCQGLCVFCKQKRSYQSLCTFFKFPLNNPELLKKWLQNMNMSNWTPTEHSLLCSNHFNLSDLKIKGKYLGLKKNSIPTLFSTIYNNSHQSNKRVSRINRKVENIIHISICRKNTIDQSSSKELLIHRPMLKVNNTDEVTSDSCNQENIVDKPLHKNNEDTDERSMVLVANSDLTSSVHKSQLVEHDYCYKDTPLTLRQKLTKCQEVIKEQKKTIKYQKQKVKRLQNQILLLKNIIIETSLK